MRRGGSDCPSWGHAQVDVEATLSRPGQPGSLVYIEKVRVPFSALFYSWYRPGIVEKAYRRAYEEAFRRLAEQIAAAPKRVLALGSMEEPAADHAPAKAPPDAAPVAERTASDLLLSEGSVYEVPLELAEGAQPDLLVLPQIGPHIILSDEAPLLDGTWYGYLRLLGGVEVSGILGLAHASSSIRDARGRSIEVASGNAQQLGYRIALYSAPTNTGFFIYPVLGYLSQKISNADTRSMLEEANTLNKARGDIEAIASDPNTGERVDAGSSNTYDLDMQSGYGGMRVGYDVVHGTPRFVFFISTSLGVNIAEYRKIEAILQDCRTGLSSEVCGATREGWDFLRSGAVGATIGFKAPKAHIAVRLIFDYEVYFSFEYGRPFEVRGPLTLNEDGVYEYPRVSMTGAMLQTFSGQLALAAVF